MGCPVCGRDLLDGKHQVVLYRLFEIPLKVLVCPKVPSGMAWLESAGRPLVRLEV